METLLTGGVAVDNAGGVLAGVVARPETTFGNVPVLGSAPMVATQTPNTPPIRFLIAPPELMLASIESPKRVSAKYSGGLK